MKILIDAGHGSDTAGKRSPDGRLREYAYAREIARRVEKELQAQGYDAERIVTEESDIRLSERCRRANAICRKVGARNALLVPIHCNAAGSDGKWHDARGWSAHISLNASASSRVLAGCLIRQAELAGLKVRKYSPQEPYWRQNLAICRDTLCPAVLTENLFQDNKDDVEWLLSEQGKETIIDVHVKGIIRYIQSL